MIYAILSDVHANMIALSAVLSDAQRCGAGRIINLGDAVGYGPEPENVVSTLRRVAAVSLAGNHDAAAAGQLDEDGFIDLAADAISRHRDALSPENVRWLKSLPFIFDGGSFACAHGDFTAPESFEYVTDEAIAAANFARRREQLLFVGHSHVPGIFLTGASGKVYALNPMDFTLEDGKRYIVNPGSVGYPRTRGNTCESTYVLYDDAERTISFRRLPFTVRSVMQTGRNPKRLKKRHLAAIVGAAMMAAGAAAWLLAPGTPGETVTEVVTNRVTQVIAIGHIDRTTNCTLAPSAKKIRLQVKLAKNSPAAQLQLTFHDASGRLAGDERWTVKKSKKATVAVPPRSTAATLSAGRATGDSPATFSEFTLAPVQ